MPMLVLATTAGAGGTPVSVYVPVCNKTDAAQVMRPQHVLSHDGTGYPKHHAIITFFAMPDNRAKVN
jgi:hypothetical protein